MSTALALVEELAPDYESHPLDSSAVQLLLDLEAAGMATPRALKLPDEMSYEEAEAIVAYVAEVKNRANFYMGDALNTSETRYSELFAQIADATGFVPRTIEWIMAVCRDVPASRRSDRLHWSHHVAVKSLPARQQKRWLEKAEAEGLTSTELYHAIKASNAVERPELPGMPPPTEVDKDLLVTAAQSLVRNAELAGENVIVRREDFAQVKAALGQE